MSGSTENRASNAFEQPGRNETLLTLDQAGRMIPLVQRIVTDILNSQEKLARFHPELARLERLRRKLEWPERSRRYHLHEEAESEERHLQDALAELEVLGVVLLDPIKGRIGFPTVVNGWRAFFSWRPDETCLRYWHFTGESTLRTIPDAWMKSVPNARAASR